MFSELSLYYLNHLGIRPWIRRDSDIQNVPAELVIFLHHQLNEHTELFLKNVLQYLNISYDEKKIITTNELDFEQQYYEFLEHYKPQIVLFFGFEHVLHNRLPSNPNLLSMESVNTLMCNGLQKKSLFLKLSVIKNLL